MFLILFALRICSKDIVFLNKNVVSFQKMFFISMIFYSRYVSSGQPKERLGPKKISHHGVRKKSFIIILHIWLKKVYLLARETSNFGWKYLSFISCVDIVLGFFCGGEKVKILIFSHFHSNITVNDFIVLMEYPTAIVLIRTKRRDLIMHNDILMPLFFCIFTALLT